MLSGENPESVTSWEEIRIQLGSTGTTSRIPRWPSSAQVKIAINRFMLPSQTFVTYFKTKQRMCESDNDFFVGVSITPRSDLTAILEHIRETSSSLVNVDFEDLMSHFPHETSRSIYTVYARAKESIKKIEVEIGEGASFQILMDELIKRYLRRVTSVLGMGTVTSILSIFHHSN
jgi:hypothetical protein